MKFQFKFTESESGETVEFPGGRTALWDAQDAAASWPERKSNEQRLDFAWGFYAAKRAGKLGALGVDGMGDDEAIDRIADAYDLAITETRPPFAGRAARIAQAALVTGCSPYDLAMLDEERPSVFDEFIDLVYDGIDERRRSADINARRERVNRIFNRGAMMFEHGGGFSIEARGLSETIGALGGIDRELKKDFKRGLREDARPVLDDARGNAMAIARTGAYAASMAMRTVSSGVKVVSTDPGAGAIEFAKHGAVYLRGPRKGSRMGVAAGDPPRALVRSAKDNEDLVLESVETRIERTIERHLNG